MADPPVPTAAPRALPEDDATWLVVAPGLRVAKEEFRFTFERSGGPGGQNVNKVASKAVLRWAATTSPSLPEEVRSRFVARFGSRLTNNGELVLHGQRYRDQPRNIADCLERVRAMLSEVAVAPRKRRATKPSRGSVERRLHEKKSTSQRKQGRRPPRGTGEE